MSTDTNKNLDGLSPEIGAQFEQLRQYLDRVAPPLLQRQQPKPRRSQRSKGQVKQTAQIGQARPKHAHTRRWRPLMEGRDYPPLSMWYSRKRDQWQTWLWRTVLREGLQLLAEVGPRGFCVKELAKRVGVARSTIYKYFGLKAELLAVCMERYPFGGEHHERVSERIAYSTVLEGLADSEDRGGDGPRIAELIARYVFTVAQSPERDLWLLAAAEAVRSPRPPRSGDWPQAPKPVRNGVRTCLAAILQGGCDPATGRTHPALTDGAMATLMYAVSAITWYETCLSGPHGDERLTTDTRGPKLVDLPYTLRTRSKSPVHPRGSAGTCNRAIEWLLQGAGLADERLQPLPPLRGGRLPDELRYGHPTGKALHRLQHEAWLFDTDDLEALLPTRSPMSPPLIPPPRLPCGLA